MYSPVTCVLGLYILSISLYIAAPRTVPCQTPGRHLVGSRQVEQGKNTHKRCCTHTKLGQYTRVEHLASWATADP